VNLRATNSPRDGANDGASQRLFQVEKVAAVMVINGRGNVPMVAAEPAAEAAPRENVALLSQLPVWARSPDLYAAVVDISDDTASAQVEAPVQTQAHAASPATDMPADTITHDLTLLWRIDCFPKPWVSLMNAPLASGAAALTTFGTHRVAGENYRFAVPVVGQSLLPLAALARPLSRLPDGLGMYLALTGESIGPADAYAAGLCTHLVPSADFRSIIDALSDGHPVDPLLDRLHRDPAVSPLAARRDTIARCFTATTVDGILSSLANETGPSRDWARTLRDALIAHRRIDLEATHRLLMLAAALDVRDSLILTYRVATRWPLARDGAPQSIDEMFTQSKAEDLKLPTRADIAAGRW